MHEKDNYLKPAELSTEQNCNMIDGVPNNTPIPPTPPELRACAVCGKAFLPEGRQAYCSDACKAEGNRRKSRERMRKMREKRPGGCYDLPPPKA